jgi:NifU-like protein involved in Fe-S cluster formation
MYTKEVIERFNNPKNSGDILSYNAIGKAISHECNDIVELKILFEKEIIKECKFKVFGCPNAIATTDAFIDLAKNKTINEALKITKEDISKILGGLSTEEIHCSILPINAFKNAICKYFKNENNSN